jgi:hypothetical protein
MRTFDRVYYAAIALTLAGCACLPWLVPLSYRVLGFDPQLVDASTSAALQAHAATASLRRGVVVGVLLLAVGLLVLSVAGLVLRARRRTGLPWVLLALTAIAAAGVMAIASAALLAGGSGMCC